MTEDIKTAEPSRPVWYLLPILMGLFQSSLIAATPTFISVTGVSTIEWSILISMPTLLFLLLSPIWGKWADKLGAAYLIRFSALGLGLSIITLTSVWWLGVSFTFAPGLWLLTIAATRILYGVSASGVMPLCQSLAITPTQQSKRYDSGSTNDSSLKKLGLVSASLSIGRTLGPLALIITVSQVDWLLLMFSLFAIPAVWLIYRYSKHADKKMSQNHFGDMPHNNNSEAKDASQYELKNIRLLLVLAFSITLFVGYLQFILGPLFLDWIGSGNRATFMMSVTLTVVAATALLCQLFLVKHLNWRSPFILLYLSLILLICTLGLSLSQSVLTITLTMIPVAIVLALLTPVYTRLAMSMCENAKGKISGKLAVCHTAGYPLGSLLAGICYANLSFWWLPLSLIALVILCVASFVFMAVIRPSQTNSQKLIDFE